MILSTLDTKNLKKLKYSYFIGTLFILLFSIIYEMFSHNVYSAYMIFAFIFPLIGSFIFLVFKNISYLSSNLINISIITFTLYSIIHGVLDIYGTTNELINIYLYLGITFTILTIISLFIKKKED